MKHRDRLADRIAQVMQELGVTQQEFARLVGISQPAISLYLKGRVPPADVLYRMAQIAGVSMEWLLGSESSEPRMVRESPPAYGKQVVLLELWERLPAEIQQDLLSLLRHLSGRMGEK